MLRRAQTLLNKVGLLAAILFALVAVMPATAAVACADNAPAAAESSSAPCEDPACEHCAIVCGHGCCHAPHAASPHTAAPLLSLRVTRHDAVRWASSPGAPAQAADGLERPPRV